MLLLTRLACCVFALLPSLAYGWSATGHHIIAVLAYEQMSEPTQQEVLRVLSQHPQFDEYFQPRRGMKDQRSIDRWRIGVAGCWPDIIRGTKNWLRPATWLAESAKLGRQYVYTAEITEPVIAASRGLTNGLPALKLSEKYFQDAGAIARQQAKRAGLRLSVILDACVEIAGR